MTLYLSRLAISRRPQAAALRHLIDPADPDAARDAHHRLLWTLFADGPDRRRDFLWRSEGGGRFLVLSARPPAEDGAGLFEPPEVKEFAPDLRPGDRLSFLLRANATRTVRTDEVAAGGKAIRAHRDVVMEGLYALPSGKVSDARREARMAVAQAKAVEWMDGQGARHGFLVPRTREEGEERPLLAVADYSVAALPWHRGKRKGQPQFGILDMTGTIEVTDPAALLAQLPLGFGRAKAFGCGLMLLRRGT